MTDVLPGPPAEGAPPGQEEKASIAEALAGTVVADSMTIGGWTLVSRVTGVVRTVVIGAALGATYLANSYQAANTLPNIFLYGFLAGALFRALLVPTLVSHVDASDRRGEREFAQGFLGVAIIVFAVVTVLAIAGAPILMRTFTLGLPDRAVAIAQRRVGRELLAMLMPQIVLYGVAGTAGAVLNAHGRFALAAAGPVVENSGVIATLAAAGVLFGAGHGVEHVPQGELILLGLGSTGAVAMHAGLLWWGAWRMGVVLVPRAGWKNEEVRQVVGRTVASLGYTGLLASEDFGALIVANRVPGGVVAFQIARTLYWFPGALAANPLTLALLPQLSRLHSQGRGAEFRDELVRCLSMTLFLTIPVAVAYVALARPLAAAVSLGKMAAGGGTLLVAACLAGIGPGVLADGGFSVGAQAFYAKHDARSPLVSMIVRVAISLGGMLLSVLLLGGVGVLVGLGLSITVGDFVGAWHLAHRLRGRLSEGHARLRPSVVRSALASLLMIGPSYAVVRVLSAHHAPGRAIVGALAAAVGAAVYFAVQAAFRAPELPSLRSGVKLLLPWARGIPRPEGLE